MDVAVLRCLFVSHWQEEGIYWSLHYLYNRWVVILIIRSKIFRKHLRGSSKTFPPLMFTFASVPFIYICILPTIQQRRSTLRLWFSLAFAPGHIRVSDNSSVRFLWKSPRAYGRKYQRRKFLSHFRISSSELWDEREIARNYGDVDMKMRDSHLRNKVMQGMFRLISKFNTMGLTQQESYHFFLFFQSFIYCTILTS